MKKYVKNAFCEITLFSSAVVLMFITSLFIPPVQQDSFLYNFQCNDDCVAVQDMRQIGWPLPFRGHYTILKEDGKMIHSSKTNFSAGIVNVGLFYLIIRLIFVVSIKNRNQKSVV